MSAYQWHCVKGGVTHCKLNLLQLNLQRTSISSISFVQRFTFGKFLSQYYASKTYTKLKNGGLSAQLPLHNCFNPSQQMNETKKSFPATRNADAQHQTQQLPGHNCCMKLGGPEKRHLGNLLFKLLLPPYRSHREDSNF